MQAVGGLVSAMWAGGRAAGGPVSGSKLYEVGEGNRPELFSSGGKSYLIPGNSGRVIPSAGSGGMSFGGGGGVEVNVINNTGAQSRTQESTGADGRRLIEIIIGEVDKRITNQGSTGKAISQRFGVQPVGVSRG